MYSHGRIFEIFTHPNVHIRRSKENWLATQKTHSWKKRKNFQQKLDLEKQKL